MRSHSGWQVRVAKDSVWVSQVSGREDHIGEIGKVRAAMREHRRVVINVCDM